MPVPASDAIASDVGHGALGIRYGLRPFRDLLGETVGQRHLWVELRPKKLVATWTSVGGGVYSKTVAETFDGVILPVVGVKTLTETLVQIVAGEPSHPAGCFAWEADHTLYIRLTGDANPASTTVVVELAVSVGSHGVVQPILGQDMLANGGLEAWTGTVPDGWSHSEGTGVTLDSTKVDPLQGSYAAKFTYAAAAGGANGALWQVITPVVRQVYRFSGAYRTDPGIEAWMFVDNGSSYLGANGRDAGAWGTVFRDRSPSSEWRRFSYDFVVPAGWSSLNATLLMWASGGPRTGTACFDDVKLQHVQRYAYHEPLLSADSLPTIEAARSDAFWGETSSALGSLSLLNGGGRLEPLIAAYDWLGADAIVRVGGRYQLGGNETLIDDCPVIATGKLGAPVVTDSRVTFDMEDDRKLLQRTIPPRTYNTNGRDAYTQPDRGRARPLLFGSKLGVRPVQYDIHYTGGGPVAYGQYEYVDVTGTPLGAWWGVGTYFWVHWYASEDAAAMRNVQLRYSAPCGSSLQSAGVDIQYASGTLSILRDLRPLVITEENNKLAFNIGGATLVASVALGTYPLRDDQVFFEGSTEVGLLKAVRDAMNAAAGTADITADFVAATQKVQIGKSAGTLQLLCKTGAQAQTGIWNILGFNCATDKTGSLAYNADVVFTTEAYHQVIRMDTYGFQDDASGTYTGTGYAIVEKAPDIARFLLRVILGVPASAIDVASFVAARAVATRPCSLYIGSPRTVADVFSELETSGNMDLLLNGGVWYCVPRDPYVPDGTPELVDADFLSFESYYSPDDLYGTVVLAYNASPDGSDVTGGVAPGPRRRGTPQRQTQGPVWLGEVTDASIALRFDRADSRRFETCLRDTSDAATGSPNRLTEIATQAKTKRRRFRFSSKGKALQVPVGGKLLLTRAKGLDTTGALSQLLVRVLSKRDDWARWVSDVEAIEVV